MDRPPVLARSPDDLAGLLVRPFSGPPVMFPRPLDDALDRMIRWIVGHRKNIPDTPLALNLSRTPHLNGVNHRWSRWHDPPALPPPPFAATFGDSFFAAAGTPARGQELVCLR